MVKQATTTTTVLLQFTNCIIIHVLFSFVQQGSPCIRNTPAASLNISIYYLTLSHTIWHTKVDSKSKELPLDCRRDYFGLDCGIPGSVWFGSLNHKVNARLPERICPSAFSQSGLYHLPERIVYFVQMDSVICPKKLVLLPEGIVYFARRDCIFCPKGLYFLPEAICNLIPKGQEGLYHLTIGSAFANKLYQRMDCSKCFLQPLPPSISFAFCQFPPLMFSQKCGGENTNSYIA